MYCGRVKRLHRLDLAREPLWIEPWYRQTSGDSTHHCRSPTPKLNGFDLPPSTRTQFSEQEYSYPTVSKSHQSAPHFHNTHKIFHEEPSHILSRGRQKMCIRLSSLACSQDFSKIYWRVEIYFVVLRQQRKPHWVSFNFGLIIFVASWHALFLGD